MKNDKKIFLTIITVILIFLLAMIALGIVFIINKNNLLLNLILFAILVFFVICIISILTGLTLVHKVKTGKKIGDFGYKFLKMFTISIYPVLIFISNLLKKDKNSIRRIYADVNNLLVKSNVVKTNKDNILILLPHCLQNDKCTIKITNDIENCKSCGKCDIGDILKLKDKYGINIVVATGGTLARAWIKKTRPKCIIAVACERDLTSGINDVRHIPVMGVINDRPNGPCFNTKISVENIEEAIKTFLEE